MLDIVNGESCYIMCLTTKAGEATLADGHSVVSGTGVQCAAGRESHNTVPHHR